MQDNIPCALLLFYFYKLSDFTYILPNHDSGFYIKLLYCIQTERIGEKICNEAKALKGRIYYEKKQNQYGIGGGNYDGGLYFFGLR